MAAMSATHDESNPDATRPTWSDPAWGEIANALGLSHDYEPVSGHDHPRDAVLAHVRRLAPTGPWREMVVLGNLLRRLLTGPEFAERWPDETIEFAVRRGWAELDQGSLYVEATQKLRDEAAAADIDPDEQTKALELLTANATPAEREQLGLPDPDYKRSVYGIHDPVPGMKRIFVLHRLMSCATEAEDLRYQVHVHEGDGPFKEPVEPPPFVSKAWVIVDVGMVGDPTQILVFDERGHQPDQVDLVYRMELRSAPAETVAQAVRAALTGFAPAHLVIDPTGTGIAVMRALLRIGLPEGTQVSTVAFHEVLEVPDPDHDGAMVLKPAIDVATDLLRDKVDRGHLRIPHDRDVVNQFNGQTYTDGPVDPRGIRRRVYSRDGDFSILDAARGFALAQAGHAKPYDLR